MKYSFLFILLLLASAKSYSAFLLEKIEVFSLTKNSFRAIDFANTQKPTVVIFLSKDCPCSKGNISYLNKLAKDFSAFTFIGIHSKKAIKNEDVYAYFKVQNPGFEILNDSDLKMANLFKALKTPHVFVVSTKGEILYSGGVTNSTFPENAKEFFLKDALIELQQNLPITHPETRTLGCFISR